MGHHIGHALHFPMGAAPRVELRSRVTRVAGHLSDVRRERVGRQARATVRDYLDGAAFAELCRAKGISRDDTVVFYGDNFNWWAAYALWVFSLFGHSDLRLLDGGRQKWAAEGRELTREKTVRPPASYPVPVRNDAEIRAWLERD